MVIMIDDQDVFTTKLGLRVDFVVLNHYSQQPKSDQEQWKLQANRGAIYASQFVRWKLYI